MTAYLQILDDYAKKKITHAEALQQTAALGVPPQLMEEDIGIFEGRVLPADYAADGE